MQLRGLPELPIEQITIEGLRATAQRGIELVDAKNILLRDVSITAITGPAVTLSRVENLTMERVTTRGAADDVAPAGAKTASPDSQPDADVPPGPRPIR